ncbi:MAG TPA: PAS domain S-box protein [Methanomicrobia archaeon]|nr:PAS domain S-box protein [Methanomicrobia archaeon]HEX58601.1 PAS domain S-box protein [Methanomicrobia archaeon]
MKVLKDIWKEKIARKRVSGTKIKAFVVFTTFVLCCCTAYYFRKMLYVETFHTHLFYVPIVLAAVWWRWRGVSVAGASTAFLLGFHFVYRFASGAFLLDISRSLLFLTVAAVTALLSERLEALNKRLEELAEERGAKLDALYDVSKRVVNDASLNETLDAILDTVCKTMNIKYASIRLLDKQRNELVTVAVRGFGKEYWELRDRIKPGEFGFDQRDKTALDGRVHYTRDLRTRNFPEEVREQIIDKYGLKSYLTVPIKMQGEVIGVLSIATTEYKEFGEFELRLLSALADLAAYAITKTTLLEELTEVKMSYQELFESAAEPIIVLDKAGRILEVNKRALELSGYSKEDLLGKSILDFILEEDREKALEVFLKAIRGEDITSLLRFKGRDRALIMEATASCVRRPSRLRHDDSEAVVVIAKDVTEKKALEEELKKAYESLKRAYARERELEALKSNLITVAMHEIATPLTIIKGNVELLLNGSLGAVNAEQEGRLLSIERALRRLSRLVNDLRTVAMIRDEGLRLDIKECDVRTLVTDAVEAVRPMLKQGQQLEVTTPEIRLRCDAEKVVHALYCLLENAVKFTDEEGSIKVTVEDKEDNIEFCVADTGVGIPKDELPKIFEAFYEAGSRDVNGYLKHRQGIGVGLFVVRSVIEAHGGRVWAESEVGRGSRFFFTLPRVQEAQQTTSKPRGGM